MGDQRGGGGGGGGGRGGGGGGEGGGEGEAMVLDVLEGLAAADGSPEMRVFLKTADDRSVCLRVSGVPFWVMAQLPDGAPWDERATRELANFVNDGVRGATVSRPRKGAPPLPGWRFRRFGGDGDAATACPRTNCVCGHGAGHLALSSEPCMQVQQRDEVFVTRAALVMRKPLIGFQPHPSRYVKLYLKRACYAREAKRQLEKFYEQRGWRACEAADVVPDAAMALLYASAQLDEAASRNGFADSICTGAWVRWPRSAVEAAQRISRCAEEHRVPFAALRVVPRADVAPLRVVCYDIECASSREGRIPDPEHDAIYSISLVARCVGSGGAMPPADLVLSYGAPADPPAPPARTQVCRDERDMLVALFDRLEALAPDLLAGYNSDWFDWPFIAGRCAKLGLGALVERATRLRERGDATHLCVERHTNQRGTERVTFYRLAGVVPLDAMRLVKLWQNLAQYGLGYVSSALLGKTKEDVHHTEITPLFHGTPAERARLFSYNLTDSVLVWELLQQLKGVETLMAEARITGVLLRHRVGNGLQMRLSRLLMSYAAPAGYVLPAHRKRRAAPGARSPRDDDGGEEGSGGEGEDGEDDGEPGEPGEPVIPAYEGVPPPREETDGEEKEKELEREPAAKAPTARSMVARDRAVGAGRAAAAAAAGKTGKTGTAPAPASRHRPAYRGAKVFPPRVGYYLDEIISLDFASLYPSLIRRWNICFSVWTRDPARWVGARVSVFDGRGWAEAGEPLRAEDFQQLATGYWFLKREVQVGQVARAVERLLEGRKAEKKLMEAAKQRGDAAMADVHNSRQNALKVNANSMYGGMGNTGGPLFFPMGATSITGEGRRWIVASRAFVETPGQFAGLGFGAVGCEVLYGDTDSLMIKLQYEDESAERTMALGEKLVARVNQALFPDGIMSLAFECRYNPYLIMAPKIYATYKFEAGKKPKVMEKGTVGVRRDNAPFVSATERAVVEILMRGPEAGERAATPAAEKLRRVDAAFEFVRAAAARLMAGRVPLEQLTITQAIKKPVHQYPNQNLPHLAVARRMRRDDPREAPEVGDRVAYYIAHDPGGKVADKARPPYCAATDGPDYAFYLTEKLRRPIEALFAVAAPERDASALFDPLRYARTRTVAGRTVTVEPRGDDGDTLFRPRPSQPTLAALWGGGAPAKRGAPMAMARFAKYAVRESNGDGDRDRDRDRDRAPTAAAAAGGEGE